MSLMPSIVLLSSHLVCRGQVVAPDAAALARLLLLAPVLEEWVVRAGLQEWLIRRADGQTRAAPVALSPGLVLALLYQHRRDWRLCALAHCGMNALALGGCVL
jgi:hypothetical protein